MNNLDLNNAGLNNVDWLLDSDPAIRWQAMRDLTDSSPAAIAAERARVSREGIGARILACQQSDGSWRRPDAPAWSSTLFTLLLLRATGVDPAEPAVESAIALLEASLRWSDHPDCWDLRSPEFGGNNFFDGEEEPCINGGVLALGAYFGHPSESLARRLIGEQLDDGGWNCEAPKSTRSSFHTTICVLEGLLEYEQATKPEPEITAARKRAEEYLLKRSLFRRLSTGQIANPAFLELAFPPRYHYDLLRALDYFRAADAQPDPRISDAVDYIEGTRQPSASNVPFVAARGWKVDGRWLLDRSYNEALALPVGESVGAPSRWNTLRALRMLRWYERRVQPASAP